MNEPAPHWRTLSWKAKIDRFWDRVVMIPEHPCWDWNGAMVRGYGYLGTAPFYAHRMSWAIHFGQIPRGMCVLHKCDNRACTRPDHLFIGTRIDNAKDRNLKGRQARGESHACCRLSGHEASQIRDLLKCGWKHGDVAAEYGVSQCHVYNIERREKWKHVR